MKTVSNRKTWDRRDGWIYRMSRTVKGQRFSVSIIIPKTEMHMRRLVAFRLQVAREDLRKAVEQHRSSFT